jgi:putative Mg2+ transporter-C (MgtC) family protein
MRRIFWQDISLSKTNLISHLIFYLMNPLEALGVKELILRLTIAVLVGGTLGLNRELRGKSAGLRTHALVALGAAIAALLVLQRHDDLTGEDPNAVSRVIQGILTGIGFLGAGVILRNAQGNPTGLTTAATIWVCAIIGLLCGLGYWVMIAVSTVLVLAVLIFGHFIERAGSRLFKGEQKRPEDDV